RIEERAVVRDPVVVDRDGVGGRQPRRDLGLASKALEVLDEAPPHEPRWANDLHGGGAGEETMLRSPQGSGAPLRETLNQPVSAQLVAARHGGGEPVGDLTAKYREGDRHRGEGDPLPQERQRCSV